MNKILYIKSTPKSVEDSWSLKMSENFLENYRKHNPDDVIDELNLYTDGIQALSGEELEKMPIPEETEEKKQAQNAKDKEKFMEGVKKTKAKKQKKEEKQQEAESEENETVYDRPASTDQEK